MTSFGVDTFAMETCMIVRRRDMPADGSVDVHAPPGFGIPDVPRGARMITKTSAATTSSFRSEISCVRCGSLSSLSLFRERRVFIGTPCDIQLFLIDTVFASESFHLTNIASSMRRILCHHTLTHPIQPLCPFGSLTHRLVPDGIPSGRDRRVDVPVRMTCKVFDETWISRSQHACSRRRVVDPVGIARGLCVLSSHRATSLLREESFPGGPISGHAPTRRGIVYRIRRACRGFDIEPTRWRRWRRDCCRGLSPTSSSPLTWRHRVPRIHAYLTPDLTRSIDAPPRPWIPDLPWRTWCLSRSGKHGRDDVPAFASGGFEDRSSDGSSSQHANSRSWIPYVCRTAPVRSVRDDSSPRRHVVSCIPI